MRALLEAFREIVAGSGYSGPIDLKTLRRELARLLSDSTPAVGFLRRGVTLTELVPLRSVPFRVVCLLGMSEDSFPRADDRPSFDRTRLEHRSGDRNKRDDDRHSFLQAVLCSRDRLIVSYSAPSTGLRSGANPSPVVWELRETLRRYYQPAEGEDVVKPMVHPLHAFDRKYFDGSGPIRSASHRYLGIAETIGRPSIKTGRVELLGGEGVELARAVLSVNELAAWIWYPAQAFIERELRTRFRQADLYEPTRALTRVGALEASNVGNGALKAGLRDEALEAYLGAAPEFPDGSWGELERQKIGREIRAVNARATGFEGARGSELVTVALGNRMLEGRIDGLTHERRLLKRFTRVGRRAELLAWIQHLLMQTAEELPNETHLVLRGSETHADLVTFDRVAEPLEALETLVGLYEESRRAPVPLVAGASLKFVGEIEKEGEAKALSKAKKALVGQRRWDPYVDYVFGDVDPFENEEWLEAFKRVALQAYEPLFAHRSET
jgi:exodeoxyribonuclease V gamma subunit